LASSDADRRWLVVSRHNIALSVAGIEGYVRVVPETIQPMQSERHNATVAFGDTRCPVVDLSALLQPLLAPVPMHRNLP
jgi:hypothetical protein